MRAVSRVLVAHQGLVLVVAHGGDLHRVGIPGGGIDPGETPVLAAMREMQEETGLVVQQLGYLCTIIEPDRDTKTYVHVGTVSGRMRSSHEGKPMWLRPRYILSGKYGDFHREVFREARIR